MLLGGLKEGFCMVAYQPFTDAAVKNDAITPTTNGSATEIINCIIFLMILGNKLKNILFDYYLNLPKFFIIRNYKTSYFIITFYAGGLFIALQIFAI